MLRQIRKTADYTLWGKYGKYDLVFAVDFDNLDLYIFIQYYLDKQLRETHKYLNSKGVILKATFPIGITPVGVGKSLGQNLFVQNGFQAGLLPMSFPYRDKGFPTYNWEVMEKSIRGMPGENRFANMARFLTPTTCPHPGILPYGPSPGTNTGALWGISIPMPLRQTKCVGRGLAFLNGWLSHNGDHQMGFQRKRLGNH